MTTKPHVAYEIQGIYSCKFSFPCFIEGETEVCDISMIHTLGGLRWAHCRIPSAHTRQLLGLNMYTEFILKWINDDNISDDNIRKFFTAKCPSLEDWVILSKLGSNCAMMFNYHTWPFLHCADFCLATVSLSIWEPLEVPYGDLCFPPLVLLIPGSRRQKTWVLFSDLAVGPSYRVVRLKPSSVCESTYFYLEMLDAIIRPSRF